MGPAACAQLSPSATAGVAKRTLSGRCSGQSRLSARAGKANRGRGLPPKGFSGEAPSSQPAAGGVCVCSAEGCLWPAQRCRLTAVPLSPQRGRGPSFLLSAEQAAPIMEHYENIMRHLQPLGYDPTVHPRLTELVVNTFGILRERLELRGQRTNGLLERPAVPAEGRAERGPLELPPPAVGGGWEAPPHLLTRPRPRAAAAINSDGPDQVSCGAACGRTCWEGGSSCSRLHQLPSGVACCSCCCRHRRDRGGGGVACAALGTSAEK